MVAKKEAAAPAEAVSKKRTADDAAVADEKVRLTLLRSITWTSVRPEIIHLHCLVLTHFVYLISCPPPSQDGSPAKKVATETATDAESPELAQENPASETGKMETESTADEKKVESITEAPKPDEEKDAEPVTDEKKAESSNEASKPNEENPASEPEKKEAEPAVEQKTVESAAEAAAASAEALSVAQQ